MTKSELRSYYTIKRFNLTESQLDELSIKVANMLLQLPIWDNTYFHVFLPIESKFEINTEYILNILSGKDKNIVISKSDFKDLSMKHYLLMDNTTLKKNRYGIPEPIDGIEISPDRLEVVFVPLLAYDLTGNRVGYGKGFYDRFLSNCPDGSLKIGLSQFEAETEKISDVEENDIKLDYCVSPNLIYRF